MVGLLVNMPKATGVSLREERINRVSYNVKCEMQIDYNEFQQRLPS